MHGAADQAGRVVGTFLAEHSFVAARAAGSRATQFNVSMNGRAVWLWQRLGFTNVSTVPECFRHRWLGLVDLHIIYRLL